MAEEYGLLGFNAAWFGENPKFLRNTSAVCTSETSHSLLTDSKREDAAGRVKWRVVVNTVTKLWVPYKARNPLKPEQLSTTDEASLPQRLLPN
jgi:hypothetical protein